MSCASACGCHVKASAPFRHGCHSEQARLTVENDDRASMYSVRDLLRLHDMCAPQLPIVYDFHHWRFCTGGLQTLHLSSKVLSAS
jgi:UV DNA damage repair endonuclease